MQADEQFASSKICKKQHCETKQRLNVSSTKFETKSLGAKSFMTWPG